MLKVPVYTARARENRKIAERRGYQDGRRFVVCANRSLPVSPFRQLYGSLSCAEFKTWEESSAVLSLTTQNTCSSPRTNNNQFCFERKRKVRKWEGELHATPDPSMADRSAGGEGYKTEESMSQQKRVREKD